MTNRDLSQEDRLALDRVKKRAFIIIFEDKYESYENALNVLNMKTLFEIRKTLMLKFRRKCLLLQKLKNCVPLNNKSCRVLSREGDMSQGRGCWSAAGMSR